MTREEMEDLHELLSCMDNHRKYWEDLYHSLLKERQEAQQPFICRQCQSAGVAAGYQGREEWNDGKME